MSKIVVLLFFHIVSIGSSLKAQEADPTKTIDGIVKEGLKIISGKKGEARDWDSFRDLFAADAQFSVLLKSKEGKSQIRNFNLEEFVRSGKNFYINNDFSEVEIKKIINEYNGIAAIFQSYLVEVNGKKEKGVNAYQLMHDGERWWIISLMWTNDQNGTPLPEELDQ